MYTNHVLIVDKTVGHNTPIQISLAIRNLETASRDQKHLQSSLHWAAFLQVRWGLWDATFTGTHQDVEPWDVLGILVVHCAVTS